MSLEQLIAAGARRMSHEHDERRTFDLSVETLVASYNTHEPFRVGDIVEWKEGLRTCQCPGYGEGAVVLEVLDPPILRAEDAGSPYFRESLDVKLAVRDSVGELLFFHFDSRRFKLKRRYMTEADLDAEAP